MRHRALLRPRTIRGIATANVGRSFSVDRPVLGAQLVRIRR